MPQCPSEKAILQGAQYEGIWTHDLLLAWLDSQRGVTEPQELQLLLASTKVEVIMKEYSFLFILVITEHLSASS